MKNAQCVVVALRPNHFNRSASAFRFRISKTRGATKWLSDGSTQLSEPLLDRVDCLYTGWGFPNR